MSPEYCRPPSAITGTPAVRAASEASYTAVTCGTPTPATTRVVQIEPGPTPTLTASAPASTSACAPERVATLPPMTSMCAKAGSALSRAMMSRTPRLSPLAVSTTMTSTPASRSAPARSHASPKNPMASTSGSFSILCWANSASTSSCEMPTGPVMSGAGVMTSRTSVVAASKRETKRMSRLVMMPTRRPSPSTTGRPETRNCPQRASTSATVASGVVVTGFVIMPDSERLTLSTCCACSSIERLRCRMPRPPCRAMAIAMRASVTVSIAAEMRGACTRMRRVRSAAAARATGRAEKPECRAENRYLILPS